MIQTKSNGRGGARKGAGRKPGAATKRTRAIADHAAATGLTPLEVMLGAMHALHKHANAMSDGDEADMGGRKVGRLGLLVSAAEVAKDAAPYMHPRLQAIEHSGSIGEVRQLTDLELAAKMAYYVDVGRKRQKVAEAAAPPATVATKVDAVSVSAGSTEAPSAKERASMHLAGRFLHISAAGSTGGAL
jgi:hypothetical protein